MEAQSHRTDEVRASAGCADVKRIATFDQDGTLWVEHPMYSFVMYALKNVEPFKTVLSSNREAMAKLTLPGLEKIYSS